MALYSGVGFGVRFYVQRLWRWISSFGAIFCRQAFQGAVLPASGRAHCIINQCNHNFGVMFLALGFGVRCCLIAGFGVRLPNIMPKCYERSVGVRSLILALDRSFWR